MAPFGLKLWENAFQTIPDISSFDVETKKSAIFFEKTGGGVQQPEEWSATTCGSARGSGLRWEGVGEGKHKLSHTRPQGVGGYCNQIQA